MYNVITTNKSLCGGGKNIDTQTNNQYDILLFPHILPISLG